VHIVGSAKKAHHRIQLNVENYGRQNLSFLLQANSIPIEVKNAYEDIVSQICTALDPLFSSVQYLRIHGDLHRGNLLFDRKGFVLVDFDDMLIGPAVQDLWLMIPDRGETGKHRLKILLDGYESLRKFEPSELLIVEGLRALRYIHFSAWIAKRWSDPIFPKMFPQFGTIKYWQDQVQDLREQYSLVLDHDAWT
jgi:Ser/Thr protein kinase RdoA (MazF antagonist)